MKFMLYKITPVIAGLILLGTLGSFIISESSATVTVNPMDYTRSINDMANQAVKTQGINTTVPNINIPTIKTAAPGSFQSLTKTDFGSLINTKNLSFKDTGSILKSIAILAINLFLIVIQTVAGILRALLPFLNR